ncbi:MAG TPA: hypothetical protein VMU54_24405 [Planctomycetota bacterium]|nr:hypothetical protein [Planctomycetota bacterium]
MPAVAFRLGHLRVTVAPALLLLASCTYPLYNGRDNYAEGMRHLRYEPASAPDYFATAEKYFSLALTDEELDPPERVMAVTMRARCLIELERHADVPASLAVPIPAYSPDRNYPGDIVGLSLLKASRMDPEHAYAELLLAEKKAATLRSRVHLAWEQVHVLQKIGTPKAKAEGVRICAAHAGKIDFDELKKALEAP